jgi:hypothetical protein
MGKRLCIECAWCDLTVDFLAGSHYSCLKTGKMIPGALLDRRGCKEFVEPTAQTHWGP